MTGKRASEWLHVLVILEVQVSSTPKDNEEKVSIIEKTKIAPGKVSLFPLLLLNYSIFFSALRQENCSNKCYLPLCASELISELYIATCILFPFTHSSWTSTEDIQNINHQLHCRQKHMEHKMYGSMWHSKTDDSEIGDTNQHLS